jgi:acetyl esterase/lipase
MHKKIVLLSLFMILVSCAQGSSSSSFSSLSSISSSVSSVSSSVNPFIFNTSVSYGNDDRQVLEYAYLNTTPSPRPMVLFLHGGSWITGDKSSMRYMMDPIIESGFMYVSMNYRLMLSGATFSDMLEDIQTAIQFLRGNASFLNLDTSKMAIAGESAGAHLALLYAYSRPSTIPIVFSMGLVPPVDFTDPAFITHGNQELQLLQMNALTGTMVQSAEQIIELGYPQAWKDFSPITYAQSAVPTLVAYAGEDELIPSSNVPRLIEQFELYATPYEVFFYPNSGHNIRIGNDLEPLLHAFINSLINYLMSSL